MKLHENKLDLFVEYSREIGINNELLVINELRQTIELYFQKQIYFDTDNSVRFLENGKKVSISKRLSMQIVKSLKRLKHNYILQNKPNLYKFINKFIKGKIIYKNKTGYKIVDENDNICFMPRERSIMEMKIGSENYFFCYKVEHGVLKLRFDNGVATYIANMLTGNQYIIQVLKWKIDKLLVFSFVGEKFGKDNIKKLSFFFQNEKIIYNKKGDERNAG
jgi:hypothetical protein